MGIFDLSQDDAVKLGEFLNTQDYYKNAEKFYNPFKLDIQVFQYPSKRQDNQV